MPLNLAIVDPATLEAASNALHDAPFDVKDIRYDPTAQTFEMILSREVQGRLVPTRFRHVYREVEAPKVRSTQCRLTFRHVEKADIAIDAPRGNELIGLEYDSASRTVSFDTGGAVKIALRVTELDAEVADIA